MSGSINDNDLFVANDGGDLLLSLVNCGAPLDLCGLGLDDERVLYRVSLLVGNCEQLVLRASDQETLGVPVTMGDFLAML